MYCTNCGNEIAENSKFCTFCGNPVRVETTNLHTEEPHYSKTELSQDKKPIISDKFEQKNRHGFVTFWLWLGIISSIVSTGYSIFTYQQMKNLGYYGIQLITAGVDLTGFYEAIDKHVLIWQAVALISGICLVVFYVQLLKWFKSGFWGLSVTAIIVSVINIVMMHFIQQDYDLVGLLTTGFNPTFQIASTILSILLLWAILQIKKNGVSCWRQLN